MLWLAGRGLAWGGLGWGGLVGSCLLFLFLVAVLLFDLVEGGELYDCDVCAGGFACDEGEGLGLIVAVEREAVVAVVVFDGAEACVEVGAEQAGGDGVVEVAADVAEGAEVEGVAEGGVGCVVFCLVGGEEDEGGLFLFFALGLHLGEAFAPDAGDVAHGDEGVGVDGFDHALDEELLAAGDDADDDFALGVGVVAFAVEYGDAHAVFDEELGYGVGVA